MASKLPLLLCTETGEISGEITFILGQTLKDMERAGQIRVIPSMGYIMHYLPMRTKKINSFHIKKRMEKEDLVQRMVPGEIILISEKDSIGWGFEEPLISISYANMKEYECKKTR